MGDNFQLLKFTDQPGLSFQDFMAKCQETKAQPWSVSFNFFCFLRSKTTTNPEGLWLIGMTTYKTPPHWHQNAGSNPPFACSPLDRVCPHYETQH
jgi:hypothetical protein